MTRWGLILLLTYLGLGLSPLARRKSVHIAVLVTVAVIGAVMAKAGGLR